MSALRWGRGVGTLMSTAVSLATLPTLGQCRNLTAHLSMDLVARKQAKSEFMDVIDPVSKTNFGTEPITQFGGSDVWDLDYTLLQSFEKEGDWTVGEVYTQAAWIFWRHKGPDFRVLFDGSGEQAITLKGSELGLSVGSDGLEPHFFGTGFHIDLDKWSFVCVVGESSGMKGTSTFYVATPEDGTVQKAGSVPMAISGAQLQSIGAEGRCPGKLAMYKCWNGLALEHDEVQQVYEETLHLVPHPRTTIPTTSTFTSVTSTSMTSTTTSTTTSTATRTSRTATTSSTFTTTTTTTRTSHTTTTTGTHTATATGRMPAELRFQLDGQPTLAESGMMPSDAEALDAPMLAATTTSVTSSTASLSAEEEAESLAEELDFIGIETRPPTTTSTTATTTPAVVPATPSAGAASDSHSAVGGPGVGTPSGGSSLTSPTQSSSASAGSAEAENRVSSGSSTASATSQEASSLSQNHTGSVYSIWGEDTAQSRAGAAESSATESAAGTQAAGATSPAAPGQNSSLASASVTTPGSTAASAAASSSLAGQGASVSGLLAGQVSTASYNTDSASGAVASANETVGGAEGASTGLQSQTVSQSQTMGQEHSQAGRYADEVSQAGGVSSGSQKAGRYVDEASQVGGVSSGSQKAIPAATASAGRLTHSQVTGPAVGLPPPVSVAAPQLPQDVGVSFQAPELPTVPSVGLSPSVGLHNGMQPDGSFHFPWWALLITLGLLLCAGAAAIWACCINQASEAKKSRGARLLEASSGSYAALPTDESTAALEAGNRAKMAAVSGAAASAAAHQQHSKTHMAAISAASSGAVAAGARGASREGTGGARTGAGVAVRGAGQLVGRGPAGARVPLVPLSLPPPQPAQPVQPVLPPSTAALQRGVQTMQKQQLLQQQQPQQQQQLVQLVQLEGRQQLPLSQAQLPVSQAQLQLVGAGAQVRAPSPSQVLTASPSQVITQSQSAANTTTELLVELLASEPVRMVSPPSSPSKTAGQSSGRPLPPHRVHRQSAPAVAAQAPAGRSAPTTTAVLLPARLSASRERG